MCRFGIGHSSVNKFAVPHYYCKELPTYLPLTLLTENFSTRWAEFITYLEK